MDLELIRRNDDLSVTIVAVSRSYQALVEYCKNTYDITLTQSPDSNEDTFTIRESNIVIVREDNKRLNQSKIN